MTAVSTSKRALASKSFREFLQSELARRCSENASYSLRAFALSLQMDHSSLSKLLRGKRAFSTKMIERICAKLKLDESVTWEFVSREASRQTQSVSTVQARELTQDTMSLVTSLRHFAILELVRLSDFRADSRWIARVLGLSVDEVNIALTRLIRLGLLKMAKRDQWTDETGERAHNVDDFTFLAVQRLAERVKALSERELRQSSNEKRKR